MKLPVLEMLGRKPLTPALKIKETKIALPTPLLGAFDAG